MCVIMSSIYNDVYYYRTTHLHRERNIHYNVQCETKQFRVDLIDSIFFFLLLFTFKIFSASTYKVVRFSNSFTDSFRLLNKYRIMYLFIYLTSKTEADEFPNQCSSKLNWHKVKGNATRSTCFFHIMCLSVICLCNFSELSINLAFIVRRYWQNAPFQLKLPNSSVSL